MRRLLSTATAFVLLATSTGILQAQDDMGFFKSPVFMIMPSIITLNAISPPKSSAPVEAKSAFNVRFQTVLPTSNPYITGVAGVQFMPNGPGGSSKLNQPIVFYGAIIPIIQPKFTGGWLSVSVDPLGVYFLNPRGGNHSYSHEFVLEGAAVLNVGAKMAMKGLFQSLAAFFLMDQRLTHPDRDVDGNDDHFDPVLVYGLILPIAPWKK